MTKEKILSIEIGNTLRWLPDLDSPDLQGFKHSSQFSIFEEKDVIGFEFRIIENRHGFSNSFSYEMRAIKKDGSYLNEFEYLHDDYQQKDFLENPKDDAEFIKDLQNRVWVETDEDTRWLGYLLSKGENYFDLI